MADELIEIEVAYAQPSCQRVIALNVPPNTTVAEALEISGLLNEFPEIDLSKQKVGVFGQLVDPSYIPKAEERIELYRPLTQDPMAARRRRVLKK